MKEIGTVKIHCLSEALSPITHMMGVSGNESILNREKVYHNGVVKDVPFLSGNALRHNMIREPGALFILEECGLKGKLTIEQGNFLLTGGSLCESSINDNLPMIAEMQKVLPLYRLLGGSLLNQVIGGSLLVSRGYLCCEENKNVIEKMSGQPIDRKYFSCEYYVSNYQYTRGEVLRRKDSAELIDNPEQKDKSNLMIYNGQTVIRGSYFYHDIILQNVSIMEVGAALHAMVKWQESGGTIGGSARIGHGRLKTSIGVENLVDWFGCEKKPEELIAEYENHVKENKDRIIKWLFDAFPNKKVEL